MGSKYIVEFIGTFFLVLTIALTKNPLAVAGVLMVMVYLGGHISGAHYNPAVSTTLFLQKKIASQELAKYTATQFIAAMAAAFVYFLINNSQFYITSSPGVSFAEAVLVEALFTFALCTTVLQTAVNEKTKGNSYFGLAIGAIVGVAGLAIGPISGAALNPAVGIGPLLIDLNLFQSEMNNVFLYIIGPIVGAIMASLVYSYLNRK